ncbi:hypothetical protein F0562_018755 [Nyssa sinensis]|uniref:H(+)-exporting diphosphatase n=1 Tax=Nyssa sinensis TaxID=561372 RepID=A0A5J4ZCX9_9ASTE|nr:hypothetical protein F0562_018755 [Nyssa sinensis]
MIMRGIEMNEALGNIGGDNYVVRRSGVVSGNDDIDGMATAVGLTSFLMVMKEVGSAVGNVMATAVVAATIALAHGW